MAILLIRTVNGENAQRYMDGDVVVALPDDHVFGRMESLRVWVAEGLDPAKWPGGFAVVELPGLAVADARPFCADGAPSAILMDKSMPRRRDWKIDYPSLERRTGDRATLVTEKYILRQWSEVSASVTTKDAASMSAAK